MAGTNNFIPFCPNDTGTNLIAQGAYEISSARDVGNQPGIASAKLNNKAIRQASAIAAAIAQYMVNQTGDDVLDNDDQAALLATMAKAFVPPGTVIEYAGTSAPTGYLLCDGSSKLRASYPALFTAIGTTFGSADGTHFNVPDRRGVFARGVGAQTIGGITYTGAALGTKSNDSIQGHKHGVTDPTHLHTASQGTHLHTYAASDDNIPAGGPPNATNAFAASPPGVARTQSTDAASSGAITVAAASTGLTVSTPTTDGSNGTPRTGAETVPASIAMNFYIKAS